MGEAVTGALSKDSTRKCEGSEELLMQICLRGRGEISGRRNSKHKGPEVETSRWSEAEGAQEPGHLGLVGLDGKEVATRSFWAS